ncbi:YopX family protein [Bacillus toyonensis]|uniref:YopX family protein n=1 Tax=Bacillus toyonensis TaxID=155322 RepID=UPI003D1F95BF
MREIKFRAFDEEFKVMYSGEQIEGEDNLDAWLSYGELAIYRIEDGVYVQLQPLQHTGFRDRNGTDIFEKDIVHIVGVIPGVGIDEIGIVKSIDGSWMIENLKGTDGWLLFQEGTEIEVLGNVFENPELLQGGNR